MKNTKVGMAQFHVGVTVAGHVHNSAALEGTHKVDDMELTAIGIVIYKKNQKVLVPFSNVQSAKLLDEKK